MHASTFVISVNAHALKVVAAAGPVDHGELVRHSEELFCQNLIVPVCCCKCCGDDDDDGDQMKTDRIVMRLL